MGEIIWVSEVLERLRDDGKDDGAAGGSNVMTQGTVADIPSVGKDPIGEPDSPVGEPKV